MDEKLSFSRPATVAPSEHVEKGWKIDSCGRAETINVKLPKLW